MGGANKRVYIQITASLTQRLAEYDDLLCDWI